MSFSKPIAAKTDSEKQTTASNLVGCEVDMTGNFNKKGRYEIGFGKANKREIKAEAKKKRFFFSLIKVDARNARKRGITPIYPTNSA